MSYQSYDPYEPYEQYENGDQGYGPQYPEQQPYPEQYGEQQPYSEQQPYPGPEQYGEQQPYPEQYGEPYQQPYAERRPGYPPRQRQPESESQPQYQDAQWAQSGLGWERQAWDEARLGVSPLQEQGYQEQQGRDGRPEGSVGYQQYDEYGQYEETQQYDQYDQYEQPAPGVPRQRTDEDYPATPPTPAEPRFEPDFEPEPATSPARSAPPPAAPAVQGRGAFGAAGIAVVAAVAALASSGALLVVVALIQAGVAYGWQHATSLRENGRADKRVVVLTALIGWVATAGAFRLSVNDDFIGLPATLGVGFLLLAADQTLRPGALGEGDRVAGLGIAVTGGLFALLPAGFVAAERLDSGLTAACAIAAALGVLCCALLGRKPVRGIIAALVLGAGVGAVAAQSLNADGGTKAGALGGAVAALAAATAVGALDRVAAEGDARGSTRIVTQVLPVALAAMGALFAAAVYR